MIRSAEWVRGYFDGEGCVQFSSAPTPWGRNASLVVETTDLDLMRDLTETFVSWKIDARLSIYPPKRDGKRMRGRVAVKRRQNIEIVLAGIRPLSEKHEARLQVLLDYWSSKDRHESALACAVKRALGKESTWTAIAASVGVSYVQLASRIAYLRRVRDEPGRHGGDPLSSARSRVPVRS